jgi:hypothetical protein
VALALMAPPAARLLASKRRCLEVLLRVPQAAVRRLEAEARHQAEALAGVDCSDDEGGAVAAWSDDHHILLAVPSSSRSSSPSEAPTRRGRRRSSTGIDGGGGGGGGCQKPLRSRRHSHSPAGRAAPTTPTRRGSTTGTTSSSSSVGEGGGGRRQRRRSSTSTAATAVRSYQRAGGGMLRGLALLVGLPAAALAAYFCAVHAWRMGAAAVLAAAGRDVLWSAQAPLFASQAAYHAAGAAAHCEPGFTAVQARAAVDEVARLEAVQDALLYGSPLTGTSPGLQTSPATARLMVGDGCVGGPAGAPYYTPADCAGGFYHGLVSRGLQAAVREYALAVKALAAARLAAVGGGGGGGGCAPDDLSAGPPRSVRLFGEDFLAAGLAAAASARADEATAYLRGLAAGEAAAAAALTLAMAAVYMTAYRRTVARVDVGVKDARRLLLLIPGDAMAAHPALAAEAARLADALQAR